MANNFPNLLPSLNLDMVNGIYVDPRITFTRAGTRTYYGQEVVKAEENLLIRSQEFDNAVWIKTNTTITANTTIAPDGTTTAETFTASSGTNAKFLAYTISLPSGFAHTISFFVQAGTYQYFQILQVTDSECFANFDVTAGAGVVGTKGSKATSSITDAGNGWYRCIVKFDATSLATTTLRFYMSPSASATFGQSLAATGTETLFLWGAQVEQRSFATAYTATTTQPITRYQRLLKTAAANEWPREFDPVTGECLGRSVWESRTNLLLRSEEFDDAYWTKTNATVSANQIIAPDGVLKASRIVDSGAGSVSHSVSRNVDLQTGSIPTNSIFVKADTGRYFALSTNSGLGNPKAIFDTQAGVFTATVGGDFGITSTSVSSLSNGWYRISITAVASANARRFSFGPSSGPNLADTTYEASGLSFFVFGAQAEVGAFATPYIPTVASQVTRLADSAVMTGDNFSSWFNPEQGCLFAEYSPVGYTAGGSHAAFSFSSGATNNHITLRTISDSISTNFAVTAAGVSSASILNSTQIAGTFAKVTGSYIVNNFLISAKGAAVTTDTSGVLPIVNQARIGNLATATSNPLNGYIKRLTYYNQALTAANLQAVTR